MTNNLFRDLLEGRIPMPARDPFPFFRARYLLGVELMPWQVEWLRSFMGAAPIFELQPLHPEPPADPRARALWAKEQQGHGPQLDTLRNRGRVTRYKEKR